MAAVALIKLSQGAAVPPGGRALVGVQATNVLIENTNNTDVASWRIEVLYAEEGLTFAPTDPGTPVLVDENAADSTPTSAGNPLSPDGVGSWRIRLQVWDGPNFTGNMDEDIRVFSVPTPNFGFILPPYQVFPLQLSNKPHELNFDDQPWGWTGLDSITGGVLINEALKLIDGSSPSLQNSYVGGNTITTDAGNGDFEVLGTENATIAVDGFTTLNGAAGIGMTSSGGNINLNATTGFGTLEADQTATLQSNSATAQVVGATGVTITVGAVNWAWPTVDAAGVLSSNGAGVLSFGAAPASTLQATYEAGNTIVTSAPEGDFSVTGTENATIAVDTFLTLNGGTGIGMTSSGGNIDLNSTTGFMNYTSDQAASFTSTNGIVTITGGGGVQIDATTGNATLAAAAGFTTVAGNTGVGVNSATGNINLTATTGFGGFESDQTLTLQSNSANVVVDAATVINLQAPTTVVSGDLVVQGDKVISNTTEVVVEDNFINLNQGHTTNGVARPGGLVVNLTPQTAAVAISGGAFTSATTVEVAGLTIGAGDYFMIDGADDPTNDGLYQVTSYVDPVLTINAAGDPWTQSGFTTDASVAGTVSPMQITVIRGGTDGLWEQGVGTSSPLTFSDFASAASVTLTGAYQGGNTLTTDAGNGSAIINGTEGFTVDMDGAVSIDGAGGTTLSSTDSALQLLTQGGSPGNITITAGGGSSSATATLRADGEVTVESVNGGGANLNGSDGVSGGSGSPGTVRGGASSTTGGNGGAAQVLGGNVDAGSANGVGGGVNITSGFGRGNGDGGTISITGGTTVGAGTGEGGPVLITGGSGGTVGDGGAVFMQGGGTSTAFDAGDATVRGGSGGVGGTVNIEGGQSTNNNGGQVNIEGGQTPAGANGFVGGSVNIIGGFSQGTNAQARGGHVFIDGGPAAAGNQDGGSVFVTYGVPFGTGDDGFFRVRHSDNTIAAEFTTSTDYDAASVGEVLAKGATGLEYISPTDSDAIHDNVAGEIAAVTLKSTPVSGDFLLIEDSADSNNKKRVTVGSLPFTSGPGSSTDNAIARYNGTTGDIQNSGVTIDDNDNVSLGNADIRTARLVTFNSEIDQGNTGASPNVDWTAGAKQRFTMNNATPAFTFTAPAGPTNMTLVLEQDGAGSRSPTWPGTARATDGSIDISSAGSSVTVINIYYDGTNYHMTSVPNSAGSVTTNLV